MVTFHGSQVKIAVKAGSTPAYTDADATTDFSLDYSGDLEEIYQHGDRDPQELKEGHVAISGSIARNFKTGNFSAAGMTFHAMATGATEFHVAIFPEGDALPKIDCEDVKFYGWSLKAPLKGVVQETCKFKGLALTLTE